MLGSSLSWSLFLVSSFKEASGKGQLSDLRTWSWTTFPSSTSDLLHISLKFPGFSFRYWTPLGLSKCCLKYWWPMVSCFRASLGRVPLWFSSYRMAVRGWASRVSGLLECSLTWDRTYKYTRSPIDLIY